MTRTSLWHFGRSRDFWRPSGARRSRASAPACPSGHAWGSGLSRGRSIAMLVSVTLLGAVACEGGEGTPGGRSGGPPKATASRVLLRAFDSCEALERYIEDGMVEQMKVEIDLQLRSPFGAKGGVLAGAAERAATGAAPAPSSPGSAGAPASDASRGSTASAPTAVTRTNTQVEGVDEADFVKNDKNRIFVLTGGKLHALASWPPQDLALRSGLAIEGNPREMFLDEKRNRIVVISDVFTDFGGGTSVGGSTGAVPPDARGVAAPIACPDIAPGAGGVAIKGCGGSGGTNSTRVTVVDVSNLASPSVLESYLLPGSYVNSRRVDGAVRVVLTDQFQNPEGVTTYLTTQDPGVYNDRSKLTAAFDRLKTDNERRIRARKLDDWLPKPRFIRMGNQGQVLAYSCNEFYFSDVPTRTGLVSVATLNLDTPGTPPSRTSVVAEPGEIYASRDNLYMATRHWWWWDEAGQVDYTYLHKFDIKDPSRARYVASGGVEGHILDQFAMDEHEGTLRVATNVRKRVGMPASGAQPAFCCNQDLWSRVTTLGERQGGLVMLGQTEDLAKGEQIKSARFLGGRGYVVTFRQIDPLFTFDLTDPYKPRKVGKLEVPGFSSYLHPIGPNHLLTIGVYLPEPVAGQPVRGDQRRVQLQVFDVSNLADPKTVALAVIGTTQGSSEALDEHKAFNYFPEKRLLAIPFTDQVSGRTGPAYWDAFVSDVRVFEIAADTFKISERGRLSMKDVYATAGRQAGPGYAPYVRRSVMATDGMQDFVYAISDAGVRVANLASVGVPLKTAVLAGK